MYEYLRRQFSESEFDPGAAALSADGWRLICVLINPFYTAEAAPLYITFWERALP